MWSAFRTARSSWSTARSRAWWWRSRHGEGEASLRSASPPARPLYDIPVERMRWPGVAPEPEAVLAARSIHLPAREQKGSPGHPPPALRAHACEPQHGFYDRRHVRPGFPRDDYGIHGRSPRSLASVGSILPAPEVALR